MQNTQINFIIMKISIPFSLLRVASSLIQPAEAKGGGGGLTLIIAACKNAIQTTLTSAPYNFKSSDFSLQYDMNGVAIICSPKTPSCQALKKLNLNDLNNLVHSHGVTCNVKEVWESAASSNGNNVAYAAAYMALAGVLANV